jgi:Matrixin
LTVREMRVIGIFHAALAAAAVLGSGPARAQTPLALGPLETGAPIGYFIANGAPGSQYRSGDRDLASWALQAWERNSNGALHFVPSSEASARLRLYWVTADGGQYGETRPLMIDGERGAAIYIRPDTDQLGEEIGRLAREDGLYRDSIVYLTCLHEIGHGLGLEHTAEYDDVMYYFGFGGDIPAFFARYRKELGSRDAIASHSGLSAGDLRRLHALYPAH